MPWTTSTGRGSVVLRNSSSWPDPSDSNADRGLREGILMNLMREDGVWRRRRGR